MARSDPDDGTYTLDDSGYDSSSNKRRGASSSMNSNNSSSIPILKQLFVGCEDDAPGSVHRAWAITVLFMVIFFAVSISEGESLLDTL
jgi:hypothetical protein